MAYHPTGGLVIWHIYVPHSMLMIHLYLPVSPTSKSLKTDSMIMLFLTPSPPSHTSWTVPAVLWSVTAFIALSTTSFVPMLPHPTPPCHPTPTPITNPTTIPTPTLTPPGPIYNLFRNNKELLLEILLHLWSGLTEAAFENFIAFVEWLDRSSRSSNPVI